MLSRTFSRLTLPGKIVFTAVPLLLLLAAALTAAAVVSGTDGRLDLP